MLIIFGEEAKDFHLCFTESQFHICAIILRTKRDQVLILNVISVIFTNGIGTFCFLKDVLWSK